MIVDYKTVSATLKLSKSSHVVAARKMWTYRQADWERFRDMLDDTCWDHLKGLSTTIAIKWITHTALRAAETCIPLTTFRARKSSPPWINVTLVDVKRTAHGTPLEMEIALACSAGLAAEYHDYIVRTAQKMRELKPSSKLCGRRRKKS